MGNSTLISARKAKADEFYTQLSDIEAELRHYKEHFRGKTVLCNCDDPFVSNFFHYFAFNFEALGLKRLITTCYRNQDWNLFSANKAEAAIWLEYNGDLNGNRVPDPEEIGIHRFHGDGDFRSAECVELLKQADIVVTNPPFSLFSEFIAQLLEYDKRFLVIGNQNAITYKDIFPLLRDNKMWIGYRFGDMSFRVPDYYEPRATRYWQDEQGKKWRSMGNICWFTNLDIPKRHEPMVLYERYDAEKFPYYDNYDAINVDRVDAIPCDYDGVMGVPVTFMGKYCPEQFEILGATESEGKGFSNGLWIEGTCAQPVVDGIKKYKRLFIRRKK